jgi:hypothetical protein
MRDFLAGGGPGRDTLEDHRRWGYLARLFFLGVNRENGTIQHLPFDGALMDQPSKVLAAFELMQGVFMEHLKKLTERN